METKWILIPAAGLVVALAIALAIGLLMMGGEEEMPPMTDDRPEKAQDIQPMANDKLKEPQKDLPAQTEEADSKVSDPVEDVVVTEKVSLGGDEGHFKIVEEHSILIVSEGEVGAELIIIVGLYGEEGKLASAQEDLYFGLEVSDGTASEGTDYTWKGSILKEYKIPAGEQTMEVVIQVKDDDAVEGDEDLYAALGSLQAGKNKKTLPADDSRVQMTIEDDEKKASTTDTTLPEEEEEE